MPSIAPTADVGLQLRVLTDGDVLSAVELIYAHPGPT
jgi:hypothetical protein